ncbi:MAG: polysaccharide biosynthesis/export family protein [Gammaproteobacteria bacterium]|nr:polysaccharide biosynthesis/export family protein [Gammaproteobacteria bacterium]
MLTCVALSLGGCLQELRDSMWSSREPAPKESTVAKDWTYRIGPGDSLNIFVWRNPELSQTVAVRPDGKFSTPLVKEFLATGKTPPQLAVELEKLLGEYVRDPLVTVTPSGFVGEYEDQVRVVGEATRPTATPYKKNMSILDLMIQVGGLTEFAAGNRAVLVRYTGGKEEEYKVRLHDLVKDGDISANVAMQPGDILIIPEAWF